MRLLVLHRAPLGYLMDALKLCAYAAGRHAVTYLSFDSLVRFPQTHGHQSVSGVKEVVIPRRGRIMVRYARWLHACLIEAGRKYDIVYVYYFPGCCLLPLRYRRTRFVLDIRSGSVSPSRLRRNVADRVTRLEAALFDRVMVISEGLRDSLGLVTSAAHVLPLGADPIANSLKRFDALHLLYVGTFDRRRIEDTLVGLGRFCRDFGSSGIRYTIIGHGCPDEVQRIRQSLASFEFSGVVEYHGHVPHHELVPYFERCNVGVSYIPITPYFDYQPPTKTYEYLLAGMPVIATATAAHRRTITKQNGVLISDTPDGFYEGLCRLRANSRRYRSNEVRQSADAFTWKHIILDNALPYLEELCRTSTC